MRMQSALGAMIRADNGSPRCDDIARLALDVTGVEIPVEEINYDAFRHMKSRPWSAP
jgi:hypothetical protein